MRIFSVVLTILTLLTVIAIIDRALAELFNTTAVVAFFFFNTLELMIAFIIWLVKSCFIFPVFLLSEALSWGIPIDVIGHFEVLPNMFFSFIGGIMVLIINSFLCVSGWIFTMVVTLLNLVPFVNIPKNSESILLYHLIGFSDTPPNQPPAWLDWLISDEQWQAIYIWFRDTFLNITILDKSWFDALGSDFTIFLRNNIPLAREILWNDVLHMPIPNWFALGEAWSINYDGTEDASRFIYTYFWDAEDGAFGIAPVGITRN